jgi:hypothetical protein
MVETPMTESTAVNNQQQ